MVGELLTQGAPPPRGALRGAWAPYPLLPSALPAPLRPELRPAQLEMMPLCPPGFPFLVYSVHYDTSWLCLSFPQSLPWILASSGSPQFFQSHLGHAGPSVPAHLPVYFHPFPSLGLMAAAALLSPVRWPHPHGEHQWAVGGCDRPALPSMTSLGGPGRRRAHGVCS